MTNAHILPSHRRQLETIREFLATYWSDHDLNISTNTTLPHDLGGQEAAECLDAIFNVLTPLPQSAA